MTNRIRGLLSSVAAGVASRISVSSATAGTPAIIDSRSPALVHVIIRFKAFIVVPSKNLLPVKIKASPSPS